MPRMESYPLQMDCSTSIDVIKTRLPDKIGSHGGHGRREGEGEGVLERTG